MFRRITTIFREITTKLLLKNIAGTSYTNKYVHSTDCTPVVEFNSKIFDHRSQNKSSVVTKLERNFTHLDKQE